MKPIKTLILLVLLPVFFAVNSFAHDTDIYAARGEGVQPNILIIFDNSLSMNEQVPCQPIETKVYEKKTYWGGYYWDEYADSIDAAITKIGGSVCPVVRSNLENPGYHDGNTRLRNGNCTRNRMTLATGAWININDPQHADLQCPKIEVARDVIIDFLTDIQNVRVGVMIFNSQGCEKDQYGVCIPGGSSTEYEGGKILEKIDSIDNNRSTLISKVGAITAQTYTPLAETLYEAGLYFKGQRLFDPNSYESPIQYSCQKNYVIIITDGKSTKDHNAVLSTVVGDYDGKGEDPYGPSPCSAFDPCYDSGGTDYLNDVAKYLYDNQGISTYTIGFAIDYDLLKRAAEQGNGQYYTANDAQQLQGAFISVIEQILGKSTSFVAPIVPVSRMERTTAGDKIYLALFKPQQNSMWYGNIKMYGVAQNDLAGQYRQGDVLDRNNIKAVDDNGLFYEGSISYWNTTQDGGEVTEGGAGEVLLNRTTDRNIYTYIPSRGKKSLTDTDNAFTTDNTYITLGVLNLSPTGDPQQDEDKKNDLIDFVHGYDAYYENVPPATKGPSQKRSWILGSFLHSRPYLIHYGPSKSRKNIVFAGSNDGMLHAFDDSDGSELWAFIPPDLLPKLQYLHSDYNESFVDGSPKAHVVYDSNPDPDLAEVTSAILIFGERRGGNRYYALNVTDPNNPEFLWYISPTERVAVNDQGTIVTYATTDYEELAQSWSTPVIRKIACQGGGTCVNEEKWVAFIGGGYDNTQPVSNQDKGMGTVGDPYTTVPDSSGRAIYVVDISDGSLVKSFSFWDPGYSTMTYSIPSDIASVDVNGNGKIDRLYVGDVAGRMWRFDIGNSDPSSWTGKIIFKSNPDGATTNLRKIFYPPDVTLEYDYEMVFFGTGDREHPNDKVIVNRLYAVKDRDPSTAYVENDLYDATYDLLQTGTATEKADALSQLNSKGGWFIQLLPSTSGEKSLAPPVVFYRIVYFTTFTPSGDAPDPGVDPCYVGEGTARLYALGYKTAAAAFNLDLTNDIEGTKILLGDRSLVIGTAIPSGVIITIINDEAAAYVGMGGGVISSSGLPPDLANPNRKYIPLVRGKSVVPVNWRLVF